MLETEIQTLIIQLGEVAREVSILPQEEKLLVWEAFLEAEGLDSLSYSELLLIWLNC